MSPPYKFHTPPILHLFYNYNDVYIYTYIYIYIYIYIDIQVLNEKLKKNEIFLNEYENLKLNNITNETNTNKAISSMNSEKKRADSISKELKRIMKDNTITITEFEKALQRKSIECNELYEQLEIQKRASTEAIATALAEQGVTIPNAAQVVSHVSESIQRLGSYTAGIVRKGTSTGTGTGTGTGTSAGTGTSNSGKYIGSSSSVSDSSSVVSNED
jgi:hypothetical protein